MDDIQKEIMKSIVGVARTKEFYGHIVQQFEKVIVNRPHPVDVAAVGRPDNHRFVKLFINADYFQDVFNSYLEEAGKDSNSRAEAEQKARQKVSGAVEHETIHMVLRHLEREFPDKQRANVAMDCVVNPLLHSDARLDSWVMPQRYDLPENETVKYYYDNLPQSSQYQQDAGNSEGGEFGSGGEQSEQSQDESLHWTQSGHSMWGNTQDPATQGFIRDVVKKAYENTSSESWGNVPGFIRESVEELLEWTKPKIPWRKVLRDFCASSMDSMISYTVSRESRRFGTRPGTRKQDMLRVGVLVDTSGSISSEEIAAFFNEIRWIWRNGSDVTIIEADTQVERSYSFRGKFDGTITGRGGTNLEPALKKAEEDRFDVAIYFTDFYAPEISRRYRLPVLWVLSNPPEQDQWPAQWGKAVTIEI